MSGPTLMALADFAMYVAVLAGIGACVANSAQLAPYHPEKVLLVRKEFAEKQPEEHQRLIAALLEACNFCDQPENQRSICELLSMRHYVNAPLECLEAGLIKTPSGPGGSVQALHGAAIFHRCRANDPTAEKAAWITGRLATCWSRSSYSTGLTTSLSRASGSPVTCGTSG